MTEEIESPPPVWWTTLYSRSLVDFEWMASPQAAGEYFRTPEVIGDLTSQRARIMKRGELHLILTFIGSAIILAGGLPTGSHISILGIEGPASFITLQLLAIFVAAIYSRYLQLSCSAAMIGEMLYKLTGSVSGSVAEFILARWDASVLWMNVLRDREVGYQSPKMKRVLRGAFTTTNVIFMFIHMFIVFAAISVAVKSAWDTVGPKSLAFLFASLAALGAVVMTLVFIFGFLIPLPFRWRNAMDISANQSGAPSPAQSPPPPK